MTRVAVLGALGRMGSLSAAAIESADGLELVARIDAGDTLESLVDSGAEVVIDFTSPDVVMSNIEWCVNHSLSMVVGTSGFDQERIDQVRALLGDKKSAVLIVPNFSIGAVLMMSFAQQAARHFDSAEIIEMHHPQKVDAPSGTAIRTAQLIAQARHDAALPDIADATLHDPGHARGSKVDGISVHSIRAEGFVASQEIIFGSAGESFTIRHDSHDRVSFMSGVIAATRSISGLTGVHIGLETVLEF